MAVYSATAARSSLYHLIDEVATEHKPLIITGKRANAVLISEEDWSAIQETLHLASIPGMSESIKDGLKIPLKNCKKELDW